MGNSNKSDKEKPARMLPGNKGDCPGGTSRQRTEPQILKRIVKQ